MCIIGTYTFGIILFKAGPSIRIVQLYQIGKLDRTGSNIFRFGFRSRVLDQFGLRSGSI